MSEIAPGIVYGSESLAQAYDQIEVLKQIHDDSLMRNELSTEEYGKYSSLQAHQEHRTRAEIMDAIEHYLIRASLIANGSIDINSYDSEPPYSGVAAFICYTNYLAVLDKNLVTKADKFALAVTSLIPNVPILMGLYTPEPRPAIVKQFPKLILKRKTCPRDNLSVTDESNITFGGELKVMTALGYDTKLPIDRKFLLGTAIGSESINSYLHQLHEAYAKEDTESLITVRSLVRVLNRIHKTSAPDDCLTGAIEQ